MPIPYIYGSKASNYFLEPIFSGDTSWPTAIRRQALRTNQPYPNPPVVFPPSLLGRLGCGQHTYSTVSPSQSALCVISNISCRRVSSERQAREVGNLSRPACLWMSDFGRRIDRHPVYLVGHLALSPSLSDHLTLGGRRHRYRAAPEWP